MHRLRRAARLVQLAATITEAPRQRIASPVLGVPLRRVQVAQYAWGDAMAGAIACSDCTAGNNVAAPDCAAGNYVAAPALDATAGRPYLCALRSRQLCARAAWLAHLARPSGLQFPRLRQVARLVQLAVTESLRRARIASSECMRVICLALPDL